MLKIIDESKDDIVRLMQEVIRFKTINPPGNETPCAQFLAKKISELGFTTQLVGPEKERANVVAKLKGRTGKPHLLCYAHTDVVPPGDVSEWKLDPFAGCREGDKIFGRGAQDHKFPIPPLIFAIKAIREAGVKLDGDLTYTFTANEEGLGEVGFNWLVEQGYFDDTDTLLYAVSGRGDKIGIGANGQQIYEITVRGKVAHTSRLEEGDNAILKAVHVILGLQELTDKVNARKHPLTGKARMSINIIGGGLKDNVVPDKCVITVDRRITPSEDFDEATQEIDNALQEMRRKDPQLNVERKTLIVWPAVATEPNSEIVKILRDIVKEMLGVEPKVTGGSGSSDYTWYVKRLKKPVASYGINHAEELAHAPNEYCLVPDLVETTKAYALLIMRYLAQK